MCFTIYYDLNDFSAEFGKEFVGAGWGLTCPYK